MIFKILPAQASLGFCARSKPQHCFLLSVSQCDPSAVSSTSWLSQAGSGALQPFSHAMGHFPPLKLNAGNSQNFLRAVQGGHSCGQGAFSPPLSPPNKRILEELVYPQTATSVNDRASLVLPLTQMAADKDLASCSECQGCQQC